MMGQRMRLMRNCITGDSAFLALWAIFVSVLLTIYGYWPAGAKTWLPIIIYLACGLVLAPALSVIGWLLILERRYELDVESARRSWSRVVYRSLIRRPLMKPE